MRNLIRRTGARRRIRTSATRALLLALALASTEILVGLAQESQKRPPSRDGYDLFAVPRLVLASNQFQCILENIGVICSYTPELGGGGGWFPTGTADPYVFASGFQIVGITEAEAGPWAQDTAGALFWDGRWRLHGTHVTQIYDSLDPDDLENWPAEAYVTDGEIFAPILIGRKTASQHDTWVQYWDGDPAQTSERAHPMGIKVTQRSMIWNYPSGNESVIYFVLDFENVTADPEFQQLNELAYFGGDDALPNEGWAYRDVYVAFSTDDDVSNPFQNFSTAILPFDMAIAYHGGFLPEGSFWEFPPSVFHPPFFTDAPGISGIKYLKSPANPATGEDIGLSMMSVYTIGQQTPFPEPIGIPQVWRYLSGNLDLSLGDPACNVPAEIQTFSTETTERSICYIPIKSNDVRYYQASGPFTLAAGESSSIVAARIIAPTVETLPGDVPSGIIQSENADANPAGVPSFHPGFASARGCDVNGANCTEVLTATENDIKTIERGAGWISYEGPGPTGPLYPASVEHPSNRIDQFDVRAVPGSLLGRALVAQTVFENQFLLGFPPEQPAFYLVPGDDNVTVVWEPSTTESAGDPFYEVAGDPESALYNPNYRQFDVEGYRIWRGTVRGQLELIKQFDFEDSRFYDRTCETVHPEEDVGAQAVSTETGDLVPVIGYAAGEICPFDEDNPMERRTDNQLVFNNGSPGGTPGAGVTRMPTSATVDTAILSDRDVGPVRPLADTGVPYQYVDTDVVNNFTYFYSVTAFDLNSMASGPHTLRSTKVDQSTVPRADAPEVVYANLELFLAGEDGEPLNPEAPLPRIDELAGTFDGPMPATDAVEMTFQPLLERLLPELDLSARIDSVVPVFSLGSSFGTPTADCPVGGDPFSVCLKGYLTISRDGADSAAVVDIYNPWWTAFGEEPLPQTATLVEEEVEFDPEALEAFGIPAASGLAVATGEFNEALNLSSTEGSQNRRWATEYVDHGGSRWLDGDDEQIADPARYIRVGHLDAADTVWSPIAYTSLDAGVPVSCFGGFGCSHFEKVCFERAMGKLGVASDFEVTWQGGTVSVRNVTHRTVVPFAPKVRASWGFLTADANGNGFVDWNDFNYLDPALETIRDGVGGGECGGADQPAWVPVGPAVDLVDTPSIVATSTDGIADGQNFYDGLVATGTGFGLYIHGERYIFEMSELPADGTTWTLRTYSGAISSDPDAFETEDPTGYTYVRSYTGAGTATRPLLVPGLTLNWRVEAPTAATGATDLTLVHTVPDPYLATSRYDLAPSTKQLMFVNLPPRATIRIYTVTGILVDILNHDDPTGGGRAVWDVRNRNNQFVASGVYFFHVVTPEGEDHVGKFTILNRSSG
jgi:hypothetical protein